MRNEENDGAPSSPLPFATCELGGECTWHTTGAPGDTGGCGRPSSGENRQRLHLAGLLHVPGAATRPVTPMANRNRKQPGTPMTCHRSAMTSQQPSVSTDRSARTTTFEATPRLAHL